MRLMSGGWVWDLPAETEYVEIINNGEGQRVGVGLYGADHERIDLPTANLLREAEPWTKRVPA